MSKVNCDVAGLIAAIERIGGEAANGASKAMQSGADEILKRAKDYAPVDTHDLEKSIKMDIDDRDSLGRFKRKAFYIYVDEADDRVGEYAMTMHEELAPYGSGFYHLGKGSQEKDAGRGVVGGKFLERAVEEMSDHIIRDVEYIVEKTFK